MFTDDFTFDSLMEFFDLISSGILRFIISNKVVFMCFFIPVVVSCLIIVFDFILDVRDSVSYAERPWDYVSKLKGFTRYIRHKQGRTDMDEVFKKSKENADYKHKLRMEEMQYFRENEGLRHSHKVEEQNNFMKNYNQIRASNPTHNTKRSLGKRTKDVNVDVEVED